MEFVLPPTEPSFGFVILAEGAARAAGKQTAIQKNGPSLLCCLDFQWRLVRRRFGLGLLKHHPSSGLIHASGLVDGPDCGSDRIA
jgi:hypothetical protein